MRSSSETASFINRHYPALAAAALVLAAFNLTFRLGSEIVTEWDESLYAITAAEIVACGHWIGTTFMGSLDYYNTKPPLNVWLIALSFKAFGSNLVSLRLPSIVAAWLTVAILQIWARRTLGSLVALLSSLVLSTTFGFIYDHAGRSANTDALFTLLVLLAVVTCWAARERPWRLAWLGPLTAAVFLLRGMAVLLPISIVAAVELRHHARERAAVTAREGAESHPYQRRNEDRSLLNGTRISGVPWSPAMKILVAPGWSPRGHVADVRRRPSSRASWSRKHWLSWRSRVISSWSASRRWRSDSPVARWLAGTGADRAKPRARRRSISARTSGSP